MKHEAHSSILCSLLLNRFKYNTGYRNYVLLAGGKPKFTKKMRNPVLNAKQIRHYHSRYYFFFSLSFHFHFLATGEKVVFFFLNTNTSRMWNCGCVSCFYNIWMWCDECDERLNVNVLRELMNKIGNIFHLVAGGDGGYLNVSLCVMLFFFPLLLRLLILLVACE